MTEQVEIERGLSMRILKESNLRRKDDEASNGQTPVVHYTGWFADEDADDGRGEQFESSRDNGKYFHFKLGAGRVIQGWDKGIVGMKIGEIRELSITSRLAYGKQGNQTVPPDTSLIFEVELLAFV
jgi:FKBP-type peptidyl-prolyl cis-trans isomerase FkpA